jgi:hypothetical protein
MRTRIDPEFMMSLNPHPIVLTAASERQRAELLALAEPAQRSCPALCRVGIRLRWRVHGEVRDARGIRAQFSARDGAEPSRRAAISAR